MKLATEPNTCMYGIFSALETAWSHLRHAVLLLPQDELQCRLLFHIDEAMCWESVHDISRMINAFLWIRHYLRQARVLGDWIEPMEDIEILLHEIVHWRETR